MSETASISASIAARYAQALFDISKEEGALDALEADAGSLQAFVAATNTDLLSELAGTASSFRSLFPDDAEQLVAAVQAPADEYLALVRSVLPPTPGAPSWSADQLVAALGTLATDMGRVGAIAPGARLHA